MSLRSSRLRPIWVLAGGLALVGILRSRDDRTPVAPADESCEGANDPACAVGGPANESGPPTVIRSVEACRNVGYLCAELEGAERIRLTRWTALPGPLVVHIPRPDFELPDDALRLQQAAGLGVRAWNRQPFEILLDLRGDRSPHFSIRWVRALGGNQLGVARTRWSSATGLEVVSIELATRNPRDPNQLGDPRQIRLTAAHEMGHALGLPHSDRPRDVMYPTNTATALSARDYRTMESLYALPDGVEIVR